MPENKRISGWVTRFILMMLQGTELVCGSQGVLEIPAGCLESSVVHVEGELSFGKCTLFEVSKGVAGCHQRYVHTRVQNDPVFLKVLRNEQKKEPKLSILVGPQGSPKKTNQDSTPCTIPGLRPYFQVHSGRLSPTSRGGHAARETFVLRLSCSPCSYLSARGRSPQQPVNPFQTHMGVHMWFLVA